MQGSTEQPGREAIPNTWLVWLPVSLGDSLTTLAVTLTGRLAQWNPAGAAAAAGRRRPAVVRARWAGVA